MNRRIAILLSVLLTSYLSIGWIRSGDGASAVAPTVDLSAIASQLGPWTAEEVEIADDTVQVLKAQAFFNRIYRDTQRRQVSLHVANWTNPETISAAPHHPDVCYQAAGWKLMERRTVTVTTAGDELPMEMILFQKGQGRVVTGHWFRVGDVTFVDSDGFKRQRRRFWGLRAWPDTTKFLLQTSMPTLDLAEPLLIEFAVQVADAAAVSAVDQGQDQRQDQRQ